MFGRKKRPTRRPAVAGEVCTCGEPAVVVFDHPALGVPQGSCLKLDPEPRTGPCPFCGTTGKHTTDGICPAYTLRPAWATPEAQKSQQDSAAPAHVHHFASGEVRP